MDKAVQSRKGSWDADRTVLLADISTAHLAQLLGPDGLAAWLDGVPVEWEDLPFAAVAVRFSNLHGPFLWGSCRYRPDPDPATRAHLEPVLFALGLPATQRTRLSAMVAVRVVLRLCGWGSSGQPAEPPFRLWADGFSVYLTG